MSTEKTTTCGTCGKEIAKNAKTCPHCGGKNKKAGSKKLLFAIIAIIIIIIAVANSGDDNAPQTPSQTNAPQKQIEYVAYDVSELVDDLESNALKAEEKYGDQYVEITGRLSNIDSDGKYISLEPTNSGFTLTNVQCFIKTDDQKSQVAEMNKGDVITVKGKIKSVGELLGYSLDIDSIN